MTTKIGYELDWLSFTDPMLYGVTDLMDEKWSAPTGDSLVPMRGYNRALKLKAGRVDWHTDRISQKRLWTLTGKDLDRLCELDFSHARLLTDVSRVLGVTVTRLDFAADVKGAGAAPDDVERAWLAGEVKTKARRMQVIEAKNRKGTSQGKTVYIGSRTSSLFLRVYDKGKEAGSNEDHVRVELETKAPVSSMVCAQMAERGISSVGCAAVRHFVDIPSVGWYTDLLSGAGQADLEVGRKRTNWEKWVSEVALPNVIEAVRLDTPGVRGALQAVFKELSLTD